MFTQKLNLKLGFISTAFFLHIYCSIAHAQPIGGGGLSPLPSPPADDFAINTSIFFGKQTSSSITTNYGSNTDPSILNQGFSLNIGTSNRNGGITVDGIGFLINNYAITGNSFFGPFTFNYSNLMTFDEAQISLNSNLVAKNISSTIGETVFNGAHSNPLSKRVQKDEMNFWVTGDWGRDSYGSRSGNIGLSEIGFGYNFGTIQINIGIGETWAHQNLVNNSLYKTDGNYLLTEVLIPLHKNIWGTLSVYKNNSDFKSQRGYETANGIETSFGNSNSNTLGWRARLDFENITQDFGTDISPYIDLSQIKSDLDAYTENNGSFPARFDKRKDQSTTLRLGINGKTHIGNGMNLISTIENAYRLQQNKSHISGQLAELIDFDYLSSDIKRNWLRASLGIESKFIGGVGSFTVNTTTKGPILNTWLSATWQKHF